jgi:hypothetical protein
MYKPLPTELRLGFSDIHDIGVFAKEGIAQGTNLGMTHIKIRDHIIRTPLGGFLNHSEGEELTLKYTFYTVTKTGCPHN